MIKLTKKKLLCAVALVLFGFVIFVGVRFLTYKEHEVHYHANFALYIDGTRDEFKGPGYYEEVVACHEDHESNPSERSHMHGNVNDVIHVHAEGVTWGHFFANIGYTLSDSLIQTHDKTYVNGENGQLKFILNGKQESDISNRKIESEDRLLIDFGNDDDSSEMKKYDDVAKSAHEYNTSSDPSTCGSSAKLGFWAKLNASLPWN